MTAGDAFGFVRDQATKPRSSPPLVGLELEWLTYPSAEPVRRVTPEEVHGALLCVDLPCGGAVTIEPGGQVELSTQPFASLGAALDATKADSAVLRAALGEAGIETWPDAVDRIREPARVVSSPRYDAMERYFDALGPEGRMMMCNTASLQINVDPGGDPSIAWQAASAMAPLLNGAVGLPQGVPSRRSIWAAIDPGRTAPVGGLDAGDAWAAYALAARVMFIRVDGAYCEPVLEPLSFGAWVTNGHRLGWPEEADLAEHLTTLFPPVRPRGHLELRSLDALPDDRWPAAAAVASAVVLDEEAARAVAGAGDRLDRRILLDAALGAIESLGVGEAVGRSVEQLARGGRVRT